MDPTGLPKMMRMTQQIEDKTWSHNFIKVETVFQKNNPCHPGQIFHEMWQDNFLPCRPLLLQFSPMRRQVLHLNIGVCQKPKCRKKEKRVFAFVVMKSLGQDTAARRSYKSFESKKGSLRLKSPMRIMRCKSRKVITGESRHLNLEDKGLGGGWRGILGSIIETVNI